MLAVLLEHTTLDPSSRRRVHIVDCFSFLKNMAGQLVHFLDLSDTLLEFQVGGQLLCCVNLMPLLCSPRSVYCGDRSPACGCIAVCASATP
jgi:hypothetical protein